MVRYKSSATPHIASHTRWLTSGADRLTSHPRLKSASQTRCTTSGTRRPTLNTQCTSGTQSSCLRHLLMLLPDTVFDFVHLYLTASIPQAAPLPLSCDTQTPTGYYRCTCIPNVFKGNLRTKNTKRSGRYCKLVAKDWLLHLLKKLLQIVVSDIQWT